jgi:hypothetical protein
MNQKKNVLLLRIIVRLMDLVFKVLPVMDVGHVFVNLVLNKLAMRDKLLIGLVKNVKREIFQFLSIYSSGYFPLALVGSWVNE